jgi:DNA-directed RNA polymerase sigma subunit (sigma70/sigma32)
MAKANSSRAKTRKRRKRVSLKEIPAIGRGVTKDVFDTLSALEAKVLRQRLGIDINTRQTLEKVAKRFGSTPKRILEIETKALRKLLGLPRSAR